jgi:hypothetical protein
MTSSNEKVKKNTLFFCFFCFFGFLGVFSSRSGINRPFFFSVIFSCWD